jgi:CDP-diacylglycerol--glycerol-3-phosphate 3-phosphatidyltransferase
MIGKINFNDWKKSPNLISLFRLVFIPIIIYFFTDLIQYRWWIIINLILFSLLDNLDGYVARKTNQITELGKLIDPVVDKMFVISVAINLFYYNLIPFWFLILVIARDLIIMLGGLLFLNKVKYVPASDIIGKMTVGAIGVVFLISILNFQKVELVYNLVIYLCTILIFLSLLNYGYKQIIRKI